MKSLFLLFALLWGTGSEYYEFEETIAPVVPPKAADRILCLQEKAKP